MRYSSILGKEFYKIFLTESECDSVDTHFTGAAHHFLRHLEALMGAPHFIDFHHSLFMRHIAAMKAIVFDHGDFTLAFDYSGRGLNFKENWDPRSPELPDPEMFDSMQPDPAYGLGESHRNDGHLIEIGSVKGTQASTKSAIHLPGRKSS